MLSSEEKLQHFSKMVFEEAQRQRKDILSQAEEECRLKQEQFETHCLELAYKAIQKQITLLQKESNETVSRTQAESRKQLLARREQMVEAVFEDVKKQLAVFKETEAYPHYLAEQIRKGLADVGQTDIIIYLDRSDASLTEQVAAMFPDAIVELLPEEDAVFGGARVFCKAQGALSDRTLRSMLERERQNFLRTSGLTV